MIVYEPLRDPMKHFGLKSAKLKCHLTEIILLSHGETPTIPKLEETVCLWSLTAWYARR